MNLRPLLRLRGLRSIVCVAGTVLVLVVSGCGSVANKSGSGGTSGTGGAARADGGSGGISGTGGAPGDGGADKVTAPPDGGVGGSDGGTNPNGAKWDVDNWDNAQWG